MIEHPILALTVFRVETNPQTVRPAVAADGRVDDGSDDILVLAKLLLQLPFGFSGDVGAVRVADDYAVGFHVFAEVFHILHQTRDGLGTSRFLADAHHLALVVEVDDGSDADEAAHGGSQATHATATAEELQVVGKEIHWELRHFHLGPCHDFLSGFARFQQVGHFEDDIVAQGTDTQRVNGVEFPFGLLRLHFFHRLVHDGEGVGCTR